MQPEIALSIRATYLLAFLAWGVVIYTLELYTCDLIGWLILMLAPLSFLLGYYNVLFLTATDEMELFTANYLSLGLVIVLPLLSWMSKDYGGNRQKFVAILILALILTMLSLVDFWTSRPWQSLVKHIKSILQTGALILLMYALYSYYIDVPHAVFQPFHHPSDCRS